MTTFLSSILSSINPFASSEQVSTPGKIDEIDIQVGSSSVVKYSIRNVLSIHLKLLLWNSQINSGNVSKEIIDKVREYLHDNNLSDVNVYVNQFNPKQLWHRTFSNPKTSLLSKCTIGLADCIMSCIMSGDYFNSSSNSVNILSNDLGIALHECGHAKDFSSRKNPSLYAVSRAIPLVGSLVALYQEYLASQNAISFLRTKNLRKEVRNTFKTLTPAFATYVGSAYIYAYYAYSAYAQGASISHWNYLAPLQANLLIILLGHAVGQILAATSAL